MGVAVGVVKVSGGLRLRKSATRFILQIAIYIINCDDYYKLRQYKACKQAAWCITLIYKFNLLNVSYSSVCRKSLQSFLAICRFYT